MNHDDDQASQQRAAFAGPGAVQHAGLPETLLLRRIHALEAELAALRQAAREDRKSVV